MRRTVLKRHELAGRIRAYIAQFDLAPGTRLPSENNLAALFATSRPSIRAGLIVLHLSGEIDIRPGRASYVRRPNGLCHILFRGMGPMEILKARITIESKLAAEAATLATSEDIAYLCRLVNDMQEGVSTSMHPSLTRAFHLSLASVAQQRVAGEIVGLLIEEMSTKPFKDLSRRDIRFKLELETKEHEAIFAAIVKRDGKGAAKAMRSHLLGIEERLKSIDETPASVSPVHVRRHTVMLSSPLHNVANWSLASPMSILELSSSSALPKPNIVGASISHHKL